MGDVLLTTPAIRMLKKTIPSSAVHLLVKQTYAPLVRGNPHLDRVLVLKGKSRADLWDLVRRIRMERYDLLIDWQMNPRSLLAGILSGAGRRIVYSGKRLERFLLVHFRINRYRGEVGVPLRFLESLSGLGVEDDGGGLELHVGEKETRSAASVLARGGIASGRKFIVLAPGAGRATKRWPASGYAETGRFLSGKGYGIVLAGGASDKAVCSEVSDLMGGRALNLAGTLSLIETAALIRMSELLITNDTGVMHMAAALNRPLVAVFGPTTRHLGFFPFRARSRVVETELACRPCSYHGTERCPEKHFLCMRNVGSEDVIRAASKLIGGTWE